MILDTRVAAGNSTVTSALLEHVYQWGEMHHQQWNKLDDFRW